VALGHLHRPQIVGQDHIRYSGSPLAFGFDEFDNAKSMSLIDLEKDGSVELGELPFTPMRKVRTLRGKLSDLVASGVPSEDFVKVVLTDEGRLIDPMKQISQLYPNASELTYERDETSLDASTADVVKAALTNPADVIAKFLTRVRGSPQSKDESEIIEASLKTLTEAEV